MGWSLCIVPIVREALSNSLGEMNLSKLSIVSLNNLKCLNKILELSRYKWEMIFRGCSAALEMAEKEESVTKDLWQ